MARMEGTVSAILETKGFYRIQIDGDRRYFGMGRNKPSFFKGDIVGFNTSKADTGFWQVDGGIDKVAEGPKVQTAPSGQIVTSPTTATTRTVSSGTDWAKKDKIIQKQSCRNSAIEVVRILLDKECLKLPAEKKRYDFVLALVDDLTEKYELANDGKVKEEGPKETSGVQVVDSVAGNTPSTVTDSTEGWE